MAKQTKRSKALAEKIVPGQFYPLSEGLQLVKASATAKFDESIDAAVNLGVNPKKSDQNVRGATVLPRGTGKQVRVAVFADGDQAQAATDAGADLVGMDDLAASIQQGVLDFDVCVATPGAMRVVGKLGQILGPRGLMPNPKVGTVTADVATAVLNAKAGQVRFRVDRGGIIHSPIGKASFDEEALQENLESLLVALTRAKPAAAKGQYIRRVTLSSTMGPGVRIERSTLPGI